MPVIYYPLPITYYRKAVGFWFIQQTLITHGWENGVRVHGCVTHLEIIDDKIWIHRDGLEDGIANDLVRAGISKSQIVLAFHPPEIRAHTEFAVS